MMDEVISYKEKSRNHRVTHILTDRIIYDIIVIEFVRNTYFFKLNDDFNVDVHIFDSQAPEKVLWIYVSRDDSQFANKKFTREYERFLRWITSRRGWSYISHHVEVEQIA